MMVARTGRFLMAVLALLLGAVAANAQTSARPPAFTQQQLDQILAPIALYPDSLLSQIMMAATYPREVSEAADWSRDNRDLDGDRAVRAVERYDWDPSVKSLVAFPKILAMMDEKINWTEDLGDAFLDQQAQVMDTIQYLRRQAYAAGNLRSSDQFRVDVRDGGFVVDFVNPEVAYLPYYNPVIVFGTWWWPTHQPVHWAPWPGYHARAGFHGYAWGPPVRVSRGFFYGAPDWRQRRVNVVNVNNYYYRAPNTHRADAHSHAANAPHAWQHDNARRGSTTNRDARWRQQPAGRVEANARVEPAPRVEAAPNGPRDGRERGGQWNNRGAASTSSPAGAPQSAVRTAPNQPAAVAPASTALVTAMQDGRRDGRERAGQWNNRGAAGNQSAPAALPQAEARVAPNHPAAVAPAPVVAAPIPAPKAADTRGRDGRENDGRDSRVPEMRGNDSRISEQRSNDSRVIDQRGERMHRQDPRIEANRASQQAHQPAAVAPATVAPAVRAPAPVTSPPVAAPAPAVVHQPRVAPAPTPVPAAAPVAASRPSVEVKPAVANPPARAPETAGRQGDGRQGGGSHERGGRPAPNDSAVVATSLANAPSSPGVQGPGGSRPGNPR